MQTEKIDPRFVDIDQWPTLDAVEAMLEGQLFAISAIKNSVSDIARAADAAAEKLRRGGRLVYVGAGTSGRVAVQDGVELGPTFGWPEDRLVYIIAGGINALSRSAEGAEDDPQESAQALRDNGLNENDVVIGVAASGRTPFTISALEVANAAGALSIAIANNPNSVLLQTAQHAILAETGSEIIAGSTRMKAGTAQKAILNILSTAIMLRLGRVYKGLMVDMQISNEKLHNRAIGMIRMIGECDDIVAEKALLEANGNIKIATLLSIGVNIDEAGRVLSGHDGNLRTAMGAILAGKT